MSMLGVVLSLLVSACLTLASNLGEVLGELEMCVCEASATPTHQWKVGQYSDVWGQLHVLSVHQSYTQESTVICTNEGIRDLGSAIK